ncbi:protein wech-like [Magallana gigas]|uniref:protein wech-like n=1 Tax=Magallana gigas TaxID=29159 RepID=UPI0033428A86
MALSNTVGPGVVQDVPVIAQHYLVCDTEDCENNCQFYCNPCHKQLCEQCSNEHKKSPATKNHKVVPYRQRIRKLPVEKCKDHPTKDIDMICENCQVAVCSKCSIKDHRGHTFDDLETIYSKNFTLCLDEIYNANQYYLPTSQDIKREIKEDVLKLKAFMDKIRTSIKAEAESVKRLVEKAMSGNLEQANEMEETLLEKLQSQDKAYDEYNGYLENLVKEFQGYLSYDKVQNNSILFSLSEVLNIKPIPKSTEPVYPVFTAGQYSKNDVAKLLGTVTVPTTKPASRKIEPMDITSTQLKPTRKLKEADGDELDVKQKLSLSSSVTNVKEYIVPGVKSVCHISGGKSGILWASDASGHLVQTDLQGEKLQIIKTSGEIKGYHTVTLDGNLIFADSTNCSVNRITHGKTITRFLTTKEWLPLSIHTSNLNGDILVGMSTLLMCKVARYNKTGNEVQSIERDSKGPGLYIVPHYITENINGDICVSDYSKKAVIVVNRSGQHRFSYTGQESRICPFGICTDILGHIIVCERSSKTVHLLDQDGQFLSLLVSSQKDRKKWIVNRITHGRTITRFITTEWEPLSIHTSNLNGDILVGIRAFLKGKVARYNKTGKEIQSLERDNKGQELYSEYPHYITENINGDICVSDCLKQAVIVVNKSGQHRFSYTGQESKIHPYSIRPYGICTDILGHIIVCETSSKTVHLLDQDGQFLSLLLLSQKGIQIPLCVCVDDDNNLHTGYSGTSTVIVYKYLQ